MLRQIGSNGKWGLIVFMAAACLLVAACSRAESIIITATPPQPQVSTLVPGALGPFDFPPGVNPLTGEKVSDPAVLNRRPLAVKISNAPDFVRPQAGIAAADLVFEHYVEGSLTRFTAIYWTTTPPRVGAIRSARLLDLEIPAMYGTLFAYSGASEPIRQRIAGLPFAPRAYEGITTGQPLYFRDTTIEAPHNMFIIPAEVWARAAEDGVNDPPANLGGMVFSPTPPAADEQVSRLVVNYGPDVVQWDYDPETGRYWRTVDGDPHTDANTGEQVSAANVVLIYAHHQLDLSIVESEWQGAKSFSTEIQIWTLGPAVIFRDGKVYKGYWMRWHEEDMLSFWADEAMTERLYLKPGNTWFQVVPLDFTAVTTE